MIESVQEYNERKKDYPKFNNFTNRPFDVSFGENKMAQGNQFYATIKDKVKFEISVPNNPGNLVLKVTNADKEDPSKVFRRCEKHKETSIYNENEKFHVIKCDTYETRYVGNPDGSYQSDRLTLEIPIREETTNIALSFVCLNTCFHKNKKAFIHLIFTLEDPESGFTYGRRVFEYKILHRPNRCHFNGSPLNTPKPQKRRCSTTSSDHGYESASPPSLATPWDPDNIWFPSSLEEEPPAKYFLSSDNFFR